MTEDTKLSPEIAGEVNDWVRRLTAAQGANRRHAAAELGRLGVWSRGSIRTRGSLAQSAPNRLPEPEKLDNVIQCLADSAPEVRCEVVAALGEWGGEAAARALMRILQDDPDEQVQLYCVGALCTIGGPVALEGLRFALGRESEALRDAALSAISDLATGGSVDQTEELLASQAALPADERERGAVRVRGAQPTRGGPNLKQSRTRQGVVDALSGLSRNPNASEYLRLRADQVLKYLE